MLLFIYKSYLIHCKGNLFIFLIMHDRSEKYFEFMSLKAKFITCDQIISEFQDVSKKSLTLSLARLKSIIFFRYCIVTHSVSK